MNSGLLIVGGSIDNHGTTSTAEIFDPKSGRVCKVADLPVTNRDISVCGNIVCGGKWTPNSCFRLEVDGTFTTLPVTLTVERENHLCWDLPSGEILLLGGQKGRAPRTTDRVSADGSSSAPDFDLPYTVQYIKTYVLAFFDF